MSKSVALGYRPIDEMLMLPGVRILRLLARNDWMTFADIRDVLGVPSVKPGKGGLKCEIDLVYDAFVHALARAVKRRHVERMPPDKWVGLAACAYRITPKGRAWLARQLKPDTVVIDDSPLGRVKSPARRRIVALVVSGRIASAADGAALGIGMPRESIASALNDLTNLGVLRRTGRGCFAPARWLEEREADHG